MDVQARKLVVIALAAALGTGGPTSAKDAAKDAPPPRHHHREHTTTPGQSSSSTTSTPAKSTTSTPSEQSSDTAPANRQEPAKPAAVVVDTQDAQPVLGKNVRSSAGEDMGHLIDVIVDRDGKPRAAIIDFGGFLGVGSRKIAIDWQALHFSPGDPKGNVITLELTRDQVKAAPEYKEGNPVIVLGALGSLQQMPFAQPKTQEK